MLLECNVINAKRPKKVLSTNSARLDTAPMSTTTVVLVSFVFVFLVIPRVAPCDVIGATYCIHKPEKDLKEENFEEYCEKYKEHLECVYSKYKGCDKKEKYVEAMESMIKGLRKKAKQVGFAFFLLHIVFTFAFLFGYL